MRVPKKILIIMRKQCTQCIGTYICIYTYMYVTYVVPFPGNKMRAPAAWNRQRASLGPQPADSCDFLHSDPSAAATVPINKV